jgi:hypothetical protein
VPDKIVPPSLKNKLLAAQRNMLIRKVNAEIAKRKHYEWSLPHMRKEAIRVNEENKIRERLRDPELNSMIRHLVGSRLMNTVLNKKKSLAADTSKF